MSRSQVFWIIVGIAILGVAFRSYELTARSLWFDEAFSWRLIQFPFAEMIARDAQDVHPPLYYIFLKGWSVVFGSSLLSLRSFSITSAALSLISAYLYAAYAFRSKKAGVYAALILAVSPWAISYAWEARMYPLGMVFALLSSYVLLRAVREKSYGWFVLYGILAAAFAYTHYYAFFTIIGHVFFFLGALIFATKWRIGEIAQSRLWWSGVVGAVLATLLFLPWFSSFMGQRSQVQEAYWIPPLSLSSVPDTFYHFVLPSYTIPPHHGLILIISLLPILGSLLLWFYATVRYKKQDGAWLTILLGIVPFIVSVGISLGSRSLYNDRFFAFAGIFLFILLAFCISEIKKPALRLSLLTIVVVGSVGAFVTYRNELDVIHKPGSHGAARYVFSSRTNEDKVLVSSPFVYFAILHYATEEFQAKEVPHLYSKTGELSHFGGGPILTQGDIEGPKDIAEYKGTVWVVDTTGFSEQPFAAPRNWKEQSKQVFPEVFPYQGDVIVRKLTVQ